MARTGTVTLDPINTSNTLPGVGDAGSPTSYTGRIRIADLAVTPGNADFCIRLSGTASWGEPVLRNSGTDSFFRTGLAYPQVTVPFAAPAGKIDVKFITAGGTCSSASLSEGDGIEVGDAVGSGDAGSAERQPAVTILRYGGKTGGPGDLGVPEAVVGLAEEPLTNPTCAPDVCARFRVVNAAASTNVINFGLTGQNAKALPATVTQVVLPTPILPGGTAVQATEAPDASPLPLTPVDSSGYVGAMPSGNLNQPEFTLGIVSYPGDTTASAAAVAIFEPSAVQDTQTLFFIGDSNNKIHPLQGLLVEDNSSATGPNDAGIDYQFLAKAVLTTPATISIDTFNASMYGLTAPDDDARRGPMAAALSARDTDVICVVDMDYDSDKTYVASQAAAGNFPYSYWVATTITTPPTMATDWFGNTPPIITTPACGAGSEAAVDALVSCASECSTGENNATDAGISSVGCLETACAAAFGPILSDPTCLDCTVLYLQAGYPIDLMRSECLTNANNPYGQFNWAGQTGSMILSRYPFAKKADGGADDTEAYILPGSAFRHSLLRARINIGPATQLDVYCAHFMLADQGSVVFTYAGQYATPNAGLYDTESTTDNGWRDEDSLQARDTIQWIRAQSGTNPAIVAGEWCASPGFVTDAGSPILETFEPEVYQQFIDAGMVAAHPADYVPGCEYCNSNPYNGTASITSDGTIGFDFTTTFLYNFPTGSTADESFWNTDPTTWTVSLPGSDAGLFPISTTYPRSVQILLP